MIKRLLESLSVNVLHVIVTAIIQLLAVPLFLSRWGPTYYGEWLIIYAIPAFLTLSDLGLASATDNELSIRIAKKEYDKAIYIYQRSFSLLIGLGLFFIAVLNISYSFFYSDKITTVTQFSISEIKPIINWLAFYTLVTILQDFVGSVFRAGGNYAIGRLWVLATRLVEFVAVFISLSLGGKAVDIALLYGVVRALCMGLMVIHAYSKYDWFRPFDWKGETGVSVAALVRPSANFFLFSTGNLFILQGTTLIIAYYLSPVAVVLFNTTRLVVNLIKQLVSIVTKSMWVEFTVALSNHNMELARIIHSRGLQISVGLTLLSILFFEIAGRYFFILWTKGAIEPAQPFFTMMLLTTLSYSLWNTSITVSMACNRLGSQAAWFLVSNFLSVLIVILLIKPLALVAVPIGFISADLIMVFVVFRHSLDILDEKYGAKFLKKMVTINWVRIGSCGRTKLNQRL
ncbi:hypothetical protein LC612_40135 [Nostoc sp. CHAB 5834]|nr:hypothetical protein [Nostoc sp. CHAB 5834]